VLDLLQDPLELVLGPVQMPGEPSDVGSPDDPEVAEHEVRQVRADPCDRCDVLRCLGQQHAKARLGDEVLERSRRADSAACS
jgi:hypothetical protein